MTSLERSPQPFDTIPELSIQVYIQTCPWCGVRATQWEPRVVAGVLLVRYRCWTGHDFSMTSIVGQ